MTHLAPRWAPTPCFHAKCPFDGPVPWYAELREVGNLNT
jgi:hypothetical protein